MKFDTLCGIVERHIPPMKPIMEQCRIFDFPVAPHEALPKVLDGSILQTLGEDFFLPFPTIAIEDKASVVILKDIEKNATGIGARRLFWECLLVSTGVENFGDSLRKENPFPQSDHAMVSHGVIYDMQLKDGGFIGGGSVIWCAMANKKGIIDCTHLLRANPKVTQGTLKNAYCAMEEVMYFNTPSRFILETVPLKKQGKKQGKKIARSVHRPKYTILTPGEIRRVMRVDAPKGDKRKPPVAHERRRHTRTLRSEYFKEARGRVIHVPAKWIGPKEKQVGNKLYRVRVDL